MSIDNISNIHIINTMSKDIKIESVGYTTITNIKTQGY